MCLRCPGISPPRDRTYVRGKRYPPQPAELRKADAAQVVFAVAIPVRLVTDPSVDLSRRGRLTVAFEVEPSPLDLASQFTRAHASGPVGQHGVYGFVQLHRHILIATKLLPSWPLCSRLILVLEPNLTMGDTGLEPVTSALSIRPVGRSIVPGNAQKLAVYQRKIGARTRPCGTVKTRPNPLDEGRERDAATAASYFLPAPYYALGGHFSDEAVHCSVAILNLDRSRCCTSLGIFASTHGISLRCKALA
jgi:hypothetical protein